MIEKQYFTDSDGYKKIKWGNDEHALITHENPSEWIDSVMEKVAEEFRKLMKQQNEPTK